MYRLLRRLSKDIDPESMHHIALTMLRYLPSWCFKTPAIKPVQVMGLEFKHPVGLAGGFDKDGKYLNALGKLGFAFIELGTVTPRPQEGNPKPRIFRLPKERAIINRMGFNNAGVDALVKNIKKSAYQGMIGVSIGPNKNTPADKIWDDYVYCLERVYLYADYIAINISSPNTPGLRDLHDITRFAALMSKLREEQIVLAEKTGRYVPLVIKLSPDESDDTLIKMAEQCVRSGLDGMILTNTTVSHQGETGGLSGRPLAARAKQCLDVVKNVVGDEVALIASGGIDSLEEAQIRMASGASLIQVYSGLIYEGPVFIHRLVQGLMDVSTDESSDVNS
ncbi:MAG: dihydroorotate dehydrogenase (quinone) [Legionella sp.]|jgi:dihydroorotate dehydrogenase|nr:dihydroorotate dehydrogenase (quinone) [Legionella sp.]